MMELLVGLDQREEEEEECRQGWGGWDVWIPPRRRVTQETTRAWIPWTTVA